MDRMATPFKTTNIIFYCRRWEQTVRFYRDLMGLSVNFQNDWFVEFRLNAGSRLSVADEKRAAIKSCDGKGSTIALQVEDIQSVWESFGNNGVNLSQIRSHPWNAKVFYLFDPDGHRIEIWQAMGTE